MMKISAGTLLAIYLVFTLNQIPIGAVLLGKSQVYSALFHAILDVIFFSILLVKILGTNKLINVSKAGLPPLFAYIAFCLLSSVWSISTTPYFDIALVFRDLLRIAIFLMLVSLLKDATSICKAILSGTVAGGILYGALAIPTLEFAFELGETTGRYMYPGFRDSVGVGEQAAIFFVFSFVALKERAASKLFCVMALVLTGTVLLMAFSKASIVAAAFSTFLAYSYRRKGFVKRSLISFSLISATLALLYFFKQDYFSNYFQFHSDSSIASGRGDFWLEAARRFPDRPLLGFGLNPAHSLFVGLFYSEPGTAHNEILQQLISYGIIGFALWLLMMWSFFRRTHQVAKHPIKTIGVSLFGFFVMLGITESHLTLSIFPVYLIALIQSTYPLVNTTPNTLQSRS